MRSTRFRDEGLVLFARYVAELGRYAPSPCIQKAEPVCLRPQGYSSDTETEVLRLGGTRTAELSRDAAY